MRRLRAEILNSRKFGAFQSITLVAPEIADRARPGQFVSVAMPEDRRFILRRHFSIHQASRRGGWAGTLEFVFDPHGPGAEWLAEVKAHHFLDVIGPLGRAFAYPRAEQLPPRVGGPWRELDLLPGAGASGPRQAGRHGARG